MKKVVIIGGGAAGLAAAFALKRAAKAGEAVDWVLLEKSSRLGGKILTTREDGFVVDGGPDCFLAEKPWVGQMAARLGIENQLLPSDEEKKGTYIFSRGKLHELPDGVMMMVPTKFTPFVTTSLFSWPAKIRMGLELFIPKRRDTGDETLAQFVTRRLGRECLEKLAEPMVGGVHASDPYQMSLQATFPRFLEMEQKSGSLIRGFIAARKNAPPPPPPKPGAAPRTYFMTFRGGMQQLTDAMADAAGRDKLLTGKEVVHVEERSEGSRYLVHLRSGEIYEADAVVVAAEAYLAAEFLRGIDRLLADTLSAITSASAATISLAFREDTVGHELRGFGFLVPGVENRKISASTWSSTKWPGHAPGGHVLLRAFVGGAYNQEIVELDEVELVRVVRDELRKIMGIAAEPEHQWIFRWPRGMPQYKLGHLNRLATIDAELAKHPGLYLCGASYRGVGTGDVMHSAELAVEKALQWLQSTAPQPRDSSIR